MSIEEEVKAMRNPRIASNGSKRWYNKRNHYHRTDGPTVIYTDGTEFWYKNGLKHRTDGPAVIWKSGREEWFINGKKIKPIPDFICELSRKLKDA